jgi:hypothetical protein
MVDLSNQNRNNKTELIINPQGLTKDEDAWIRKISI